jgi:hypothetical protein
MKKVSNLLRINKLTIYAPVVYMGRGVMVSSGQYALRGRFIGVGPEVEFKDKSSITARSVIEPCLRKAGYEPCLRTGFFREIFLFQRRSVSSTAQSVIEKKSIKPGTPVFIASARVTF